jgi:cytosine/adenosine deaminase-related metal-dependent hydrolase
MAVVENYHKHDRACAVAAAAAHDLNDELTIIFSSVCDSIGILEPGHPARALLLDARCAAQRCAWKASGLLNYSARACVQPVRTPLETLLH